MDAVTSIIKLDKVETNEEKLLKTIISEFNNYNYQTNELIRLQNELSKQESDLFALQIRFMHK